MKKIIEEVLFDTETATCIWWFIKGGSYDSDTNGVEEKIYKMNEDEYFLHAWGWKDTEYAQRIWEATWYGCQTISVGLEEILYWLSKNGKLLDDKTFENFVSEFDLIRV